MNRKFALFFGIVTFINTFCEATIAADTSTNADKSSCDIRSSHDGSPIQDTLKSVMQKQPCSTDTTSAQQGSPRLPEDVPRKDWVLHQIHDVQETWKNLRNDRHSIVSSILARLFKENPSSQKFFSKFANVPIESLKDDKEYNKQVTLVADRLDNIITAMDDKLQLLENIDYMKRTHVERGIPRGPWKDFSRILFDVLSSAGMSPKEFDSWKSVLTIFINGIAPAI